MERGQFVEPLRRTQSANPPSQYDESFVRKLSPLRAPTLMLVNGSGEESILPSPIVGRHSDDESFSSDIESPIQPIGHSKSLSVPNLFDSPTKSNGNRTRDYTPLMSPTRPPPSPKRTLSPPKMIIATNEGKPRPVVSSSNLIDCRIIEEDIVISIPCRTKSFYRPLNGHHFHFHLISLFLRYQKSSLRLARLRKTLFLSSFIH